MTKKRALVIDAQLFQSLALHRGVGKYSLSLLKELNNQGGAYTKRILLFNDAGMDDHDLQNIKKQAPGFSFKILPLHREGSSHLKQYKTIEKANKEILDTYIKANLEHYDVDFLILSLFQQNECPTFPSINARKCLLVYDIIPLLFSDLYLRDPATTKAYLARYIVLNEADHFFTISQTVATDITVNLGVPKDRITPIYGAPMNRKLLNPQPLKELVNKQFILLPSGDDPRKNNIRAVLAFEAFNQKHGGHFKLVITSFFDERVQSKLNNLCDQLVFTGNVSENQLAWLYKHTSLVLFPTIYEGLGMPVMEAVEFDKPVVCSSLDVFREISHSAFNFCDPYNIENIEQEITKSFRNGLRIDALAYNEILKTYTWGKTAELLLKELKKPHMIPPPKTKPKIAIFAPTPSGYSAIGKFVQEQHYIFSKLADIDYFLEAGVSNKAQQVMLRQNFLPFVTNCKDPWLFDDKEKKKYDKIIYHIGNSEYHLATLIKALSFPAIVVLHDPNIEGLYNVSNQEGMFGKQRLEAEQRLHDLMKPKEAKFITSLVSKQESVIIHSVHAKDAVEESLPKTIERRPDLVRLNLTTPVPYRIDIDTGVKKDTLTVVMAGLIHEAKGPEIVEDIAKLKLPQKSIVVKIIGFSLLTQATEDRIAKINNVQIIYSPSDTRFVYEMINSDVIVNYRADYQGEPSLAVLEAMRQGKAVIVNKQGWFDTVPDDLVYKARTKAEVINLILEISDSDQAPAAQKRLRYIEKNHNISDYIDALIKSW